MSQLVRQEVRSATFHLLSLTLTFLFTEPFKYSKTFKDTAAVAKVMFVPGQTDAVITASERGLRIWDLASNSNQALAALRFGDAQLSGTKPLGGASASGTSQQEGPCILTLGKSQKVGPAKSTGTAQSQVCRKNIHLSALELINSSLLPGSPIAKVACDQFDR